MALLPFNMPFNNFFSVHIHTMGVGWEAGTKWNKNKSEKDNILINVILLPHHEDSGT